VLAGDDLPPVAHFHGEIAEATDRKSNEWGVSVVASRCGERMHGGLSDTMQDRRKTTWGEG
jgi:hypothetical protein